MENNTLELYKAIIHGLVPGERLMDFGVKIRALAKTANQSFDDIKQPFISKLPVWAQSEALDQMDWKSMITSLISLDRRNESKLIAHNSNKNRRIENRVEVKKPNLKITCFKCKKDGHYANKCPNGKVSNVAYLISKSVDMEVPMVPATI